MERSVRCVGAVLGLCGMVLAVRADDPVSSPVINAPFGPVEPWTRLPALAPFPQLRAANIRFNNQDTADDLILLVPSRTAQDEGAGGLWSHSVNRAAMQFMPMQPAGTRLLPEGAVAVLADVDGDRSADVVTCLRESLPSMPGYVMVSRSGSGIPSEHATHGFTPPRAWSTDFCRGAMQLLAGDVDGDGYDDLIALTLGSPPRNPPEYAENQVWVARSSGSQERGFLPKEKWLDGFPGGVESVLVGDFTGDGRVDLAAVAEPGRGAGPGGTVTVAKSDWPRPGFAAPTVWCTTFGTAGNLAVTYAAAKINRDVYCDLVAFQRGAPPARPDSPTPTGDVLLALSDGARLATPATVHADFCYGNDLATVGDLNGDGCPDLIRIAGQGGADGRAVSVAFSSGLWPGAQAVERIEPVEGTVVGAGDEWRIRLDRLQFELHSESSGDEPYVVMIGFRSRIGTPGSTSTWWSRQISTTWSENTRTGGIVAVPAAQGEVRFPNILLESRANVEQGIKPELIGAVVVVMEQDNTTAATMIARVEQSRAALEAVLRRSVESARVDRLLPVLQDFQSAFTDFCRPMSSQHYTNSDFDLSVLGEVLNDDDDLIGTASFLYLAVQEDAVQRFWPPEWAPHRRQGPLIERRTELVPGSRADIGQLSMFGDGGIYLLNWEVGRVP